MNCDVIIFDCDGVIFDSNAFKADAFRDVLTDLGYEKNLVDRFVQYHKDNGGISRYVKFKVFITEYLKIEFDQQLFEKLLKEFSDHCVRSYETVSYTPHALEFLEAYRDKIEFYIASGSDEEELRFVFREKKISEYFKDILGSPKTKKECLAQVAKDNPGRRIMMVGDSKSDFLAAQASDMEFIFMEGYSEARQVMTDLAKEHKFKVVETLGDLLPK